MTTDWQLRYEPALPLNWQGRSDGEEHSSRFHEKVHCLDLRKGLDIDKNKPHIGFIGLASDEGIIRNQGRAGASQGPRALRSALAKFPIGEHTDTIFCDAGDILCRDRDLEGAQHSLAEIIQLLTSEGVHPILFGGGHEIAWGHYLGLSHSYPGEAIGVINFDAHFDLRPLLENQKGSSGTPFLQIAHDCSKKGLNFSYTCIGIQDLGNTPALFERAKQHKTAYVTAETIFSSGLDTAVALIDQALEKTPKVMVSVCLDVFAAAFAPGVSAPQPLGLYPWHIVSLLRHISKHPNVVGLHIAELSPPHDLNSRTANLAAVLAASYIREHNFVSYKLK